MSTIVFDDLEVKRRIVEDLNSITPLAPVLPGSIGAGLIDSIVQRFQEHITAINLALSSSTPLLATGEDLDIWGEVVGVRRRSASIAVVNQEDRNIRFYVQNGTFGAINNGNDIVVPYGTELYAVGSTGAQLVFRTNDDYILPSGESSFYIGASSVDIGTSNNIPANTLIAHAFQGYADNVNNTLLITNDLSITSGQDEENDISYRRRIINRLRGESLSITDIIDIIRSLPSVSDAAIFDSINGLGVMTVIVQGTTPVTLSSILAVAENIINNALSVDGIVYRVVPPVYVGVGVDIMVKHRSGLTENDKLSLERQLAQQLSDYINNLGIGTSLTYSSLERIVSSFSSSFDIIGKSGKLIDSIYRYDTQFGIRTPQLVDRSVSIELHEKIIVETSVDNPIKIIRLP